MRESTVQLSQMVSQGQVGNRIYVFEANHRCWSERRFRGDFWNLGRNLSADEQHGCSTRLSVAMVHHLPRHRVLVLHCCLVVPAVMAVSYGSCVLWNKLMFGLIFIPQ